MRSLRAARLVVACLSFSVLLASCGPRDRVNGRCEWNGDTGGVLNLSRPDDWRHLVADAQLAEDLAIRYDGVLEARGISGPQGARCLVSLVAAICARHGVTDADVQRARAHRNAGFDRAVVVSFLVLFGIAAALACRRLSSRYAQDGRAVRLGAAAIVSFAASALAVPLSSLWIVTWEMIRVGNDHLSAARAATPPAEPIAAIAGAGLIVFSIVALQAWSGPDAASPSPAHGR